jgi:hypothetical protein
MNQEEFLKAFRATNLNSQQLFEQYFGSHVGQGAFNTNNPFGQFSGGQAQTLQQLVNQARAARAQANVATDPVARKKQINDELDIIRGVVPTPPRYKVDPLRAKALMTELKQLS